MTSYGESAQPYHLDYSAVAMDSKATRSDDNKIAKKVGQVGYGTQLTIEAINRTVLALPEKSYFVRAIEEATGRCIFNDEWGVPLLLKPKCVDFLRALNANGAHVYFRPNVCRHVLLDDINSATLDVLAKDGLMPALVVQTSDTGLQVWITLSKREMTPSAERGIAHALARRYGGDPGAAHGCQFGRLPGLRNRKSKYRSPEGGYPLVKIVRRIRSFVSTGAEEFIRSLAAQTQSSTSTSSASPLGGLCTASLTMSREEAKNVYDWTTADILRRFGERDYVSDRSRLDYAVARNLVLKGFHEQEICAVLRAGSDKALERASTYVESTMAAAFRGIGSR